MAPGGSTAAVLTVTNAGTVPLLYYVESTATNGDGKGLAAALAVKVTGSASTTGSTPTVTCAGTALSGSATSFTTAFLGSAGSPRTLAAGAVERLCVEASLPSSAPTSMQTAATNVGFTFTAATSPATAWADSVAVTGARLGTATITTPTLNCGATNAQQVAVNWAEPPGATAYRIFYGTGGATSEDLPAGQGSYPLKAPTTGTAWIQAIYGSTTWTSGSSNSRTYAATGDAGTTTCS
jgi:hypothetical protein